MPARDQGRGWNGPGGFREGDQPMVELQKEGIEVLVADDEPDIRQLFVSGLTAHGMSVRPVVNGRQAVLETLKRPPDIVLMDILMNPMSGMDALGLMKILEPIRTVPVLMITSLNRKEDVVHAMKAGAADYITKPIGLRVTSEHLRRILARPAHAPSPIFQHLRYAAASDGTALRIRIDGELTEDEVDDLAVLVKSLAPIQPLRIEIDLENVRDIRGKLALPLGRVRDLILDDDGEVVVTRFDAKKFMPAPVGIIKSLFPIEEPADGAARAAPAAESKPKPAGLRSDVTLVDDVCVVSLHGELTAGSREETNKALAAAAKSGMPTLLYLDNITQADERGMTHLVHYLTELKLGQNLSIRVIVRNPDIRNMYQQAYGYLVAGIYEDANEAIASLK